MSKRLHIFDNYDLYNKYKSGATDPLTKFLEDEAHVAYVKNLDTGCDPELIYYPSFDDLNPMLQKAWGVVIQAPVNSNPNWCRIGRLDLYEKWKNGQLGDKPIGRYWLNDQGQARKCDVNDSSKFIDGTLVPTDKGQIMVYLPGLYYKVEEDPVTGFTTLWMSNQDIGGNYFKPSMVGAFMSTIIDGKLYSRPSDNIGKPSHKDGFNAAQAIGPNFSQIDYNQWRYLVMLHLAEYGTNDIQRTIGYGGYSYSNMNVGQTTKAGDQTGYYDRASTVDNAILQVDPQSFGHHSNFMGIENLYNFKQTWIQGVLNHTDGVYIYDDVNELYTTKDALIVSGNYRLISDVVGTNGWIRDLVLSNYFDIFAKEIGGNDSSYWEDYSYYITTYDDKAVSAFGYGASYLYRGLAYSSGDDGFSSRDSYCGSRGSFYGTIDFNETII